jgi:DNA-directed RNA polymerase subunit RPC12/RpoP
VNVVLVPVLLGVVWFGRSLGWPESHHDVFSLFRALFFMNLVILVFNLLPVYPLDGGQILRSLLWYGLGKARSLMAATLVGFVGVAALAWLALRMESAWMGIMAAFVALNCWNGFKQARRLSQLARLPRRIELACPSCAEAPPVGSFWSCGQCGQPFDAFATQARCPACGVSFEGARCIDCGRLYPLAEWAGRAIR